ncbi:MFS general substrate transporter [Rhodotorula diobovata]|uniref:MFS general substrate transporter n=1 Tax=Rhodotorula diobovata TaxID=5288 RepID=A0A5C5FVJ4_9BASI|nr:MFS general substrate transporter [Rhodotorula diobovata]
MASLSTTTSLEKKDYVGARVTAAPALSNLPNVDEKDEDEGARLAGYVRNDYTEEEAAAVGRKLDRRVMPLLALVYFSQFFDKNSLTYSSVMALPIKGEHFSLVSMAFYLGFLVSEIPTTMLSQRFPLGKYLGVNIILWATFLILHAASANFGFFFAMRFLLGVFESCVSPILLTYIAAMYPKRQQAKRISVFYSCNGFTNMFGGIIAWGVTHYRGDAIAHWRIMYLLMGGMAFVVGISVLLWLPDSLATATFLTEREKRYQVVEALTDPKTYILLLLTALSSIPNGGLASFSSLIIKGFGYTSQDTLLLQIPGGAIAALTTITVCQISDRLNTRMLPILIAVIPTVIGAALLVAFSGGNKAGSLAGIFLAETYGSALALQYAWTASNTGGATKKSVVNSMFLTTFALSNIIGTQIFRPSAAPAYTSGKIAILTLFSAMIPTVFCMWGYTTWLNKKKSAQLSRLIEEHGWTPEDVDAQRSKAAVEDKTDRENVFQTYVS